ncbi:copper fist DNA binding domain-containing protein [Mycena sp. CBHHK59/15]|nr:copper fist DNA binding domain-containing protein [Mycena sp. CBHHK59/15]
MVFVNAKKFACESCIKGHRSSSCIHTERPLFEVKKKGRPISQCEKCRELRQSRRYHSKCICPQEEPPSRGALLPSTKSRRFIPILPALPNGLRDALVASSQSQSPPTDARQRVDSLLNPCDCRKGRLCRCRGAPATDVPGSPRPRDDPWPSAVVRSCCAPRSPPSAHSSGNPSYASTSNAKRRHLPMPGASLAPMLFDADAAPPTVSIPTFATMMPSMSVITSLAGTGCTCGVECACPGCVEHRGPEHAAPDRPPCVDGCGTCVDARAGIALPLPSVRYATPVPDGIIERFLARAAALPAPPEVGARMTVALPKLECCGGRCESPEGICGCGKACDGYCGDHTLAGPSRAGQRAAPAAPDQPAAPAMQSCCAR